MGPSLKSTSDRAASSVPRPAHYEEVCAELLSVSSHAMPRCAHWPWCLCVHMYVGTYVWLAGWPALAATCPVTPRPDMCSVCTVNCPGEHLLARDLLMCSFRAVLEKDIFGPLLFFQLLTSSVVRYPAVLSLTILIVPQRTSHQPNMV